MITVTVQKADDHCVGFICSGHAGYADEGYDIICAAVSALAVNTANSLEAFTEDPLLIEGGEEGYLKCILTDFSHVSGEARVLMDSFLLGLDMISQNCEEEFLQIVLQEEAL